MRLIASIIVAAATLALATFGTAQTASAHDDTFVGVRLGPIGVGIDFDDDRHRGYRHRGHHGYGNDCGYRYSRCGYRRHHYDDYDDHDYGRRRYRRSHHYDYDRPYYHYSGRRHYSRHYYHRDDYRNCHWEDRCW